MLSVLFAFSFLGACSGQEAKQDAPPVTAEAEKRANAAQPVQHKEQYRTNGIAIEKPDVITAKVTYVPDGDTIKVKVNGKEETVRMILVDTPETVHPSKPVQPFGPQASNFTKQQLGGQTVGLEMDVQERDQYGRLLAYVWLGDTLYNAVLLEKGFARVAVFPPNTKYVDEFRHIQNIARQSKEGIWSIENYATDRGFNEAAAKAQKQDPAQQSKADCTIKGNISGSGEKIYHMPGQQFYDVTKPEAMFCTEAEAQAAGYRPSKR
ncbi:MAG: thermonuclease family protein [Ectobacillus sp.]